MDNNIIQWNCRGLRANFTDFRLLCDKYNPIVCCLQETMLTKDDFIIRGFNCIHLTSRDLVAEHVVGCQSWLEMASLPVSVHSTHLCRRKQSPYPRLKPLLFVHCICLQVRI